MLYNAVVIGDTTPAVLDPQRFYFDVDAARDALRRRTMFNVIDIASAWKLDLSVRKVRAKAAGSDRQLEDVAGITRVRGELLDREYIARWVRELDLDSNRSRACKVIRTWRP